MQLRLPSMYYLSSCIYPKEDYRIVCHHSRFYVELGLEPKA